MSENNNSNKKTAIIIIIIVLVIAIAAAVAAVIIFNNRKPEEQPQDTKGVVGIIREDWDPNLPEESDTTSKKGTQVPGYSTAEMKEGDTTLKLSVGNPKENHCGFFATVKLEDGTVLYESPLLTPGQGIDEIPLNKTLKKGTYSACVYYQCVLLDEENTPLNAAESLFTLIVN